MVFEIVKKELKRVFTDRRLVFSTFIIPALSIFIIYTIMGNMLTDMVEDIEEHTSTVYVGNAPESFKSYYASVKESYNINIKFDNYNKEDIIESIRNKDVDLLIEFKDDFDKKVINYIDEKTPEIYTFYNPAEEYSTEARSNLVYGLLANYESDLLINRFGNINYTKAFVIDETNKNSIVVEEDKIGASFLSMMLPMLIAILLFAGAMGIGMDTIAGEKERGTMAKLLLTPISRESIALGKVIGLGIVAILSSISSFIAILLSMPNMSESFGNTDVDVTISSFGFSPLQFIQLLVIMITLVGIYVGLISLLSVRARTVKEAGTYITPLYIVVMAAAFGTMFTRGDVSMYKFMIPVYGSITAIKELFAFELSMAEFGITIVVSLLVTGILLKLITSTFNDEKVMFNA